MRQTQNNWEKESLSICDLFWNFQNLIATNSDYTEMHNISIVDRINDVCSEKKYFFKLP